MSRNHRYVPFMIDGKQVSVISPPIERFRKKLQIEESGCWRWIGAINRKTGYGSFCIGGRGRTNTAHRWSYEFHEGKIGEGLVIDHLCRNRWCVNPKHLEPVTHAENVRRGNSANIDFIRSKITCCPLGHIYNDDNSVFRGTHRLCRECMYQQNQIRLALKRKGIRKGAKPGMKRRHYDLLIDRDVQKRHPDFRAGIMRAIVIARSVGMQDVIARLEAEIL